MRGRVAVMRCSEAKCGALPHWVGSATSCLVCGLTTFSRGPPVCQLKFSGVELQCPASCRQLPGLRPSREATHVVLLPQVLEALPALHLVHLVRPRLLLGVLGLLVGVAVAHLNLERRREQRARAVRGRAGLRAGGGGGRVQRGGGARDAGEGAERGAEGEHCEEFGGVEAVVRTVLVMCEVCVRCAVRLRVSWWGNWAIPQFIARSKCRPAAGALATTAMTKRAIAVVMPVIGAAAPLVCRTGHARAAPAVAFSGSACSKPWRRGYSKCRRCLACAPASCACSSIRGA